MGLTLTELCQHTVKDGDSELYFIVGLQSTFE